MAKSSPVKKTVTKAVKKDVPKKAASPGKTKSEPKIKYTDKSAGQEHLVPIFEKIKSLMLPYEKGNIRMIGGNGGMLCLVSQKPVVIEGRRKDEMWFAGILVQKGYVGFYFMPVYTSPEIKKTFKPELLKCLKGKSCFYIKKDDPVIMTQIKESLKIGYDLFKKRGWL